MIQQAQIVDDSLKDELERAASESKRNFGDARLLLERYVDQGKHIEVRACRRHLSCGAKS